MKRHISIFALLLGAFAAFADDADAVMRLTPVGYRLGATGEVKAYDSSVVTVTPGDTSIVTAGKPASLSAVLERDYKVIRWQKFDQDPTIRESADPIDEFGEKSETVSVDINTNVTWMYVTVVVEYDPTRSVSASLSTFGKGTVTISPEKTSYLKGDVLTLTAEPAEGYSFVRWSDGNADHVRTLTVEDDIDLTAYVEPVSSKVTFSAESDAVLGVTSKRVSYDSEYGELPVPVRGELVFTGWVDADGNSVTAGTTVGRSSDHTLYAQWEIPPESYMVVFEPNGGTGVQMRVEQEFEVGVSQKLRVNTFYKPGHAFVGWNQNDAAEEKQYSDEQIVQNLAPAGATLTLFAIWRAEKVAYTVHFDKNADDATGEMIDQQFAGGEEKPLSGCNFSRTGWTFLGWSTDPKAVEAAYQDREKVQDLTTQKELTLYAVWTKNPVYYIEYMAMPGDRDSWKSETVEQGKEYNLVTNWPMRIGYNPSGWKNGEKTYATGAKLTSQELAKMAGDGDTIVFVAGWLPISYTIVFDGNEGSCNVGNELMTYDDFNHSPIVVNGYNPDYPQRTKRAGYILDGWSQNPLAHVSDAGLTMSSLSGVGDILTVSTNLTTVANDMVTLYAIWKSETPTPPDPPTPSATTNTVTFLTNGVEYVTKEVENGKTVEKPEDPTWDGHEFRGWTNETYTTAFDFSTKITNDLELVAAWEENPQPVEDPLKKALGFNAEDPITVTATPPDCWEPGVENTINLTNDCTITFVVTGEKEAKIEIVGKSGKSAKYFVNDGNDESVNTKDTWCDIPVNVTSDTSIGIRKSGQVSVIKTVRVSWVGE